MRFKYIALVTALGMGAASIAWCADEPAPPAQAAAEPTSTEAAAKTPAKEAATAASSASDADAQEKYLLAAGYKKKTRNGQTLYCRKEIPLGSRFEKEYCGSAQDMELQAQRTRDLMNSGRLSQGVKSN